MARTFKFRTRINEILLCFINVSIKSFFWKYLYTYCFLNLICLAHLSWKSLKKKTKKPKKKPKFVVSHLWNLTVLSSLNLKLFHVLYMIFNHIILFWIYGIVSWFDTMVYRIILYYMKHYSLYYIKQCCTFIIWYIYIELIQYYINIFTSTPSMIPSLFITETYN